ncbi:MAG: DUF5681 domain-containing protein [Phycisphaerae bacterium]|nr:DUF5681 domain-containing protein [Phycisphaerae bacterium]
MEKKRRGNPNWGKKGEGNTKSGNPKGQPRKGTAFTDILKELGDKKITGSIDYKTALAQKLWAMALNGDLGAIKLIYERVDGKPRETVDLGGEGMMSLADAFRYGVSRMTKAND